MSHLFGHLFGQPTPPESGPAASPEPEPGPARGALIAALARAMATVPDVTDAVRLRWLRDYLAAGEGDMAFYAAGVADGIATHPHPEARAQRPCVDPEEYARIYNIGYADAGRHNVDLVPFEQTEAELRRRSRASGGAAQHAYVVAADLVATAIRQNRSGE